MNHLLIAWGNFFFHHRNRVFPLLMLLGVALVRPGFPAGRYDVDVALDAAGVLVCLFGQTLRVLAIGYEYIKRGGKQQQIWAGRLIQGGLFAHSRNPLYLGNILIFCGIVIIFGAPLAFLIGIPAVLFIYASIIAAEENFLRGKFGAAFDNYSARVNRLWPSWRGFSTSTQGMTFRWKRVLNKEYGTTFGWVVAAIGLRAWTLFLASRELHQTEIHLLLLLLIPVAALYAWVRRLKKSGRLSEDDLATVDVYEA